MYLSQKEKGYLAGLLDGEGYLGIAYRKKKNHLMVVFQISNTNKEVLEWVKNKLEKGSVSISVDKRGYKTVYHYGLNSPKLIEKILTQIKDTLIIKQKQANVMLEYIKNRTNRSKIRFKLERDKGKFKSIRTPIPKNDYNYYLQLRELNHRERKVLLD